MPARSSETITRQAADLDDSVMNGVNAVRRTSENITRQTMKAIDGLSQQSGILQNVAENLFSQIHGVTNRFENQGQQIMRVAGDLSDANTRIDTTLQTRHADLSRTLDRLSGKADEFGRTMADYSTNLEGSLSNIEVPRQGVCRRVARRHRKRSRTLMAELERVKSQTEAESERTLMELRHRFNSVSGELSKEFETLSTRLASASDETRLRAAEAAETLAREQARIREESARLPASSRETADAMRRALNDQLKALDKLSQISARAASQRDVVAPGASACRSPVARQLPKLDTRSVVARRTRHAAVARPWRAAQSDERAKAGRSAISWRAPRTTKKPLGRSRAPHAEARAAAEAADRARPSLSGSTSP